MPLVEGHYLFSRSISIEVRREVLWESGDQHISRSSIFSLCVWMCKCTKRTHLSFWSFFFLGGTHRYSVCSS